MEKLEHQITKLGAPDHRALGHHKIDQNCETLETGWMWFYFFIPRGSQRCIVKPHCSPHITMSFVWAIAALQVPFAMPCLDTWRTCCHSKLRTCHPSAAQPVPWCLVVERFLVRRDLTKSSTQVT